jgi:hypothetical protein
MFEKPGTLVSTEGRVDTIVANVRELRRLDSRFFRFFKIFVVVLSQIVKHVPQSDSGSRSLHGN